MFTVSVQRNFEAKHYLIGGEWGAENESHSHNYRLELEVSGERLNEHGFLVDIVDINRQLDRDLGYYEGATLNSLPEFEGLNPSLEHFSRILCTSLAKGIGSEALSSIEVRLWESETAWASYRREF